MANGRLELNNGQKVDSVMAIRTTISLGRLLKEAPDTLLFIAESCRQNLAEALDEEIVGHLRTFGIFKDGDNLEEVRNVIVCTVVGNSVEHLDLMDPTTKRPESPRE